MKAFSYPNCLIAGMVICLLLPGCASVIKMEQIPSYRDPFQFKRLVNESSKDNEESSSPVVLGTEESEFVFLGENSAEGRPPCLQLPVILRFVWLSDVQLRQGEVKLYGGVLSAFFDRLVPTFERNPMQERFDWAVYLSLIKATNRLAELYEDDPGKVGFMIHTGDAIDAGTIEELYQFVLITDKIGIPWLNAVGNHDTSVFGNYEGTLTYTQKASVAFYPVGSLLDFLWMHGVEQQCTGFGYHLLPVPGEGGHCASVDGFGVVPSTCLHGFDLNPRIDSSEDCQSRDGSQKAIEGYSGYYAFDLAGDASSIRVIVLRSAKLGDFGANGNIDEEQRKWLTEMLRPTDAGKRQRLFLVFSHHRPEDFDRETMAILESVPYGSMVFFSGHKHKNDYRFYGDRNGEGFYELNSSSILDYPQFGRLIEIRGNPGDIGCLVSRAFGSSYVPPESPNHNLKALEENLRRCEEVEEDLKCWEKIEGHPFPPPPLSEMAQCGHYGALADFLRDRKRLWGRPQSFQDSLKKTNVVIPLSIPRRGDTHEQRRQ